MKAYDPKSAPTRPAAGGQPSEELRIALTFKRPGDQAGPTKFGARMSSASVAAFAPDPLEAELALAELGRRGFEIISRGALTASLRATRAQFEAVFGTKLVPHRIDPVHPAQFNAFYFPPPGAPWNPDPAVASLIDDAYIQWPHLYMARKPRKPPRPAPRRGPSATAPQVNYHHLNVPVDVARLLNATRAHHAGITGRGVRVAMIDSGFAHDHPYFAANSYRSSVVLAAKANNRLTDLNGHGTGESANVFAVAPGATFIGVKLDNDTNPDIGASVLEGLQEALKHAPHVISVSLGYDLRAAGSQPAASLPRSLVALEVEIQAAVAAGVTIVFSAGNGHYSFPGQMPEIISAGGAFVDANGALHASDYASAFPSKIYPGRSVPDFCGLVGLLPHADYIALPIPPGCEIDRDNAAHDGTGPQDGWGVFSGTSAAAPQLAGVCALLLQADSRLTPSQIKAILRSTARDVTQGHSNRASDPAGRGIRTGSGEDGATGAGLVDAYAAVRQILR